MYFTLKKSSLGVLNICSEGICCFLQEILEQHNLKSVSCRSFYIPDDSGRGLIVLNKEDGDAEKIIIESMNMTGIETAFTYAYDGAPDIEFVYKVCELMRSPWFWCSFVAVIALLVFIGLPGIFWLSFWGSVGWFSAKFIMSQRFSSRISSWRSSVGKN